MQGLKVLLWNHLSVWARVIKHSKIRDRLFKNLSSQNFADWSICGYLQLYICILSWLVVTIGLLGVALKGTALRWSQEIKQNRVILQGIAFYLTFAEFVKEPPYAQITVASLDEQHDLMCFATDTLKTIHGREAAIQVDWLRFLFKLLLRIYFAWCRDCM